MPAGYESMRDEFLAQGLSRENAEKKAARIWNSKHPEATVTKAKQDNNPEPNKEKKLKIKENIAKIILKEIAGITGLIASPPVGHAASPNGSGASSNTGNPSNPQNTKSSSNDKEKKHSGSKSTGSSTQGFDKKSLSKAKITNATSLLGKRAFEEIEIEFNIK